MHSILKLDRKVIDKKGELINSAANRLVLNTMLVILRSKRHVDTQELQYELLMCGIFCDIDELKTITDWLGTKGWLINKSSGKQATSPSKN